MCLGVISHPVVKSAIWDAPTVPYMKTCQWVPPLVSPLTLRHPELWTGPAPSDRCHVAADAHHMFSWTHKGGWVTKMKMTTHGLGCPLIHDNTWSYSESVHCLKVLAEDISSSAINSKKMSLNITSRSFWKLYTLRRLHPRCNQGLLLIRCSSLFAAGNILICKAGVIFPL